MTLRELFESNSDIYRVDFTGESASGADFRVDITECVLSNCDLSECGLENSYFHKTKFISCDLSGIKLADCTIRECTFEKCRLTGSLFSETLIDKCYFSDCSGKYISFGGSDIRSTELIRCNMNEGSFADVKFRAVKLLDSSFAGADFGGAVLGCCDLSTCDISGARFTLNALKGVSVNYVQAAELALLLGVKIV